MRVEPLGDSALIVRLSDDFSPETSSRAALGAVRHLEAAAIPGVIELAPAYNTVGVFYDPTRVESALDESPFDVLAAKIQSILNAAAFETQSEERPRVIEVPVCYDLEFAADLGDVALHVGLPVDEVARRHSTASYQVNCVGFTPGFPYLSGLPTELATPRRATPRTEIPAGSVAIGGAQTGIYPRKSPGGWNIIGRTPLPLFDVRREPPAIFQAGDQVRFRRISRAEFDSYRE